MGFFDDKEIKNEGAGEVWDKIDRDKAWDEYFEGSHPEQLGIKYKGSPKAFLNSHLNKVRFNYKKEGKEDQPGRAERYEPVRRKSRIGKRVTPNEREFVDDLKTRVSYSVIAKILMRREDEVLAMIGGKTPQQEIAETKSSVPSIVPTMDLIWAHRWLYFLRKEPIISDKAYDALVEEEIEYGGGLKVFARIKTEWPAYVHDLAMYLLEKHKHQQGKGCRSTPVKAKHK